MSLISIIIPHYNRSCLLEQAIHSVIVQSYTKWELIIVDDQSTESEMKRVLELAAIDARIKIFQRSNGIKGPSSCRNIGIQQSKGEFIIFLDSDDLLKPFCLEQRLSAILNTDLKMAVFLMEEFNEAPGDRNKIFNHKTHKRDWIKRFLNNRNPWNVTCAIWRKDFLVELEGFNEELLYMEDPELHLKALLKDINKIETFYQYPSDSLYRINFFDAAKENFYFNSIYYRIIFYKRVYYLIVKDGTLTKYKSEIAKGVMNTYVSFLIPRINMYRDLHVELKKWSSEIKLFNLFQRAAINLAVLAQIKATPGWLKAKGITYQFLKWQTNYK